MHGEPMAGLDDLGGGGANEEGGGGQGAQQGN